MRRALIVVVIATIGLTSACGSTTDQTSTWGTSAGGDLESVAETYGRALISGDTSALIGLMDPRIAAQMTDQDRAALETLSRPTGEVELHDFALEIVDQDAASASVTYSGQRCAPTLKTELPVTTLAGDDLTTSTTASNGTVATGEVKCVDIAEASRDHPPFTFVFVNGRWYGTVPTF